MGGSTWRSWSPCHDLLWTRPALATTFFGQTDFGHGQADFGHGLSDFGDNLKLADLGRFWSGQTDLGQLWPPALPWLIWAMAWRIFGGQPDFGLAKPIWTALRRTALRRTALRRTAQNFAFFSFSPPFSIFFLSLGSSRQVRYMLVSGTHVR